MPTVAIIDYGSGNLRSAGKAFERVSAEAGLGYGVSVTSDADIVRKADRVVLPGVGAFADCKRGLFAVDGMFDALSESVIEQKKPFLGICVGMQLMADVGLEHGETEGFGWIAGKVAKITPSDKSLKIPHMGWNNLVASKEHPVFKGLADAVAPAEPHAYFVHSYALSPGNEDDVALRVDYGGPIVAAVARDNLAGTQFHPEKSQAVGLKLIQNFLTWAP